jgi:Rrf2 family protein
MRITRGADYAIRLTYCLAIHDSIVGTKQLAEETGVTQRFTLKILQTLVQSGIVTSHQGKKGGYQLNRDPREISVGLLVELIDGPVEINHCLNECYDCSHVGEDKSGCEFHLAFQSVNEAIRKQLYALTLDQFLPNSDSENSE